MQAIHTTTRTNTAIAFQYFLANIARICAQTPFFHAPRRAKRDAALRNLQVAPTAEITPARTFGQGLPVSPTARHFSLRAHVLSVSMFTKIA
jgi:hypothetical protein